MSAVRAGRLPAWQRRLVYGLVAAVIVSGLAWIGVTLSLDPQDFADPLRAWRHRALVLHGIAAYALLWLLGTLFPQHQCAAWRVARNRFSGGWLTGVLALLAVSGLSLYYPPHEDWRDATSLVHQVVGVALALLVPAHILAAKRRRAVPLPLPSAKR